MKHSNEGGNALSKTQPCILYNRSDLIHVYTTRLAFSRCGGVAVFSGGSVSAAELAESNRTIQRHLQFIDRLIHEKKTLVAQLKVR